MMTPREAMLLSKRSGTVERRTMFNAGTGTVLAWLALPLILVIGSVIALVAAVTGNLTRIDRNIDPPRPPTP